MRPLPRDEARLITLREERPTSSLERVRAIRHAIVEDDRELIWAHYRLNSRLLQTPLSEIAGDNPFSRHLSVNTACVSMRQSLEREEIPCFLPRHFHSWLVNLKSFSKDRGSLSWPLRSRT